MADIENEGETTDANKASNNYPLVNVNYNFINSELKSNL